MKALLIGTIALLGAQSAVAQDTSWSYNATFYGWFPGMTTSVETDAGTIESEASASDSLSNLDMAFMGTFGAQRGRWGFVGDLLYIDLSDSTDTPLGLFGNVDVEVTATTFSAYALYRVTSDPAVVFDIGAGFRAFDLGVDLELTPGSLLGRSQSVSDRWVDPLIAARLALPINEDWSLTGFADWGGTGGGDETWQVFGSVKYAFNDRWSTQLGYRYMDISKEIEGRKVSVDLGGPLLAVSYSF
jgi:opacity protein-like surface antigen